MSQYPFFKLKVLFNYSRRKDLRTFGSDWDQAHGSYSYRPFNRLFNYLANDIFKVDLKPYK